MRDLEGGTGSQTKHHVSGNFKESWTHSQGEPTAAQGVAKPEAGPASVGMLTACIIQMHAEGH